MKLAEIATLIYEHLKRMEADPKINIVQRKGGIHRFFSPNCWSSGSRVFICEVSFQGASSVTKSEAAAYLAWLDAGNSGKFHEHSNAIRMALPRMQDIA